ncbi:MAG: hypothetical protein CMM02_18185 [Rhodopirellula sp.]|nr:hypothetical protein [Rhodopirellula sp.]|tara:strand:- start:4112 stop:4501 length:390 start_codon:yes stop_codon:yes gene_type:complete
MNEKILKDKLLKHELIMFDCGSEFADAPIGTDETRQEMQRKDIEAFILNDVKMVNIERGNSGPQFVLKMPLYDEADYFAVPWGGWVALDSEYKDASFCYPAYRTVAELLKYNYWNHGDTFLDHGEESEL